jgi:ABC-2 type transport system permease protein
MRKILVIAGREYRAAVKTKSFIISVVIMPLIMGGSFLMHKVTEGRIDTKEKRFALVDRTPGEQLWPVVEAAAKKHNAHTQPHYVIDHVAPCAYEEAALEQQRVELSRWVGRREIEAFLEIGPDVIASPKAGKTAASPAEAERAAVRCQSNSLISEAFQYWLQNVLTDAVQEQRLKALGAKLNHDELRAILQPVSIETKGLSQESSTTGKVEEAANVDRVASVGVPIALILLMFMLILLGATPLMQGVVEEKMQRIAEVLLGSVRPFELMMGKLLGMAAVSTTLAAVYLGGGYWAAQHYGYAQYIPAHVLSWFVVYQILSVLMVGSLFIAVGAACTDMRETQAMMWPVMVLVMFPMFTLHVVLEAPSSPFAFWVSLFPFATPMLMLGRQAIPPGVPLWQPILGVIIVLLTTTLCVYIAGRIFRVGLLMQGKGARMGDLVKWVIRG